MVISEQPLAGFSDVFVERGVPAEVRGGTTPCASVYRPASKSPLPEILPRLPSDAARGLAYRRPHWYACCHTLLHDAVHTSRLRPTVVEG